MNADKNSEVSPTISDLLGVMAGADPGLSACIIGGMLSALPLLSISAADRDKLVAFFTLNLERKLSEKDEAAILLSVYKWPRTLINSAIMEFARKRTGSLDEAIAAWANGIITSRAETAQAEPNTSGLDL